MTLPDHTGPAAAIKKALASRGLTFPTRRSAMGWGSYRLGARHRSLMTVGLGATREWRISDLLAAADAPHLCRDRRCPAARTSSGTRTTAE
jgi:hypothetical protein